MEEFESLVLSEHVVIGEEIVNGDWSELDDLSELDGGIPYRVNVKVSDERFISFAFCSKCPEIMMQCTDPAATWQVLMNHDVIATVHPNGQLTVRGFFFLHLEDLVIQINGQNFPLKEDPRISGVPPS